jgi:ankyrin repeat protein
MRFTILLSVFFCLNTAIAQESIFMSAARGDLVAVKSYIENGGDKQITDHGWGILNWTVMYRQQEVLDYLLSVGVNPAKPEVAYHVGLPDSNQNKEDYPRILLQLEKAGSDITAPNPIGGDNQLIRSAECSADDRYANVCLKVMDMMIERKINLDHQNREGETALMRAGAQAAKKLLAAGASVDLVAKNGKTALQIRATKRYDIESVRILVQAGANINNISRGCNVLYDVVTNIEEYPQDREAQYQMVKFLLENGADVDHRKCNAARGLFYSANYYRDGKLLKLLKSYNGIN